MRKLLSLIVAIALVLSYGAIPAFAEEIISVTIDGIAQNYDVMPVIENGRTLVPMRGIFEALGAIVAWDEKTSTVIGVKEDIAVVLQAGNSNAKVNGKNVALDVPAKIIDGRTMVPARFVAETLGCGVNWDESTQTVVITTSKHPLDGKKVLFIGNSYTYYGRTVEHNTKYNTLSKRSNDTGSFYQLCKANGADVSVTNWTYSGHTISELFDGPCTYESCKWKGLNHEDELTDRYYDYVFVSPTSGLRDEENTFISSFEYIMDMFRAENPDVKFICLGNLAAYGINSTDKLYPGILASYKPLSEKGVIIANWGEIANDILTGKVTVPGATQTYDKNSFIVKDGHHPNMLAGYLTTLIAYCAITGESAVGQPYDYYFDKSLAPTIDISGYVDYYYVNGDADSNFPEIFASTSDMNGLQQLVDEYLAKKSYLN
ncbi:MAG: hypothetical protein IJX50_01080 [Clostridia bacterium]|nr:hypothetical protein [Clostridia bacterium]